MKQLHDEIEYVGNSPLINPRYGAIKIYDTVNKLFEANNLSRQKVNPSFFKPRAYEDNIGSGKSLDTINIEDKGI